MTTTGETTVQRAWKRDISVFLSGQTVSMFGSMLVQYAIMWHLTLETKSGVVLMASAVFGMLPQAVVSIFGDSVRIGPGVPSASRAWSWIVAVPSVSGTAVA